MTSKRCASSPAAIAVPRTSTTLFFDWIWAPGSGLDTTTRMPEPGGAGEALAASAPAAPLGETSATTKKADGTSEQSRMRARTMPPEAFEIDSPKNDRESYHAPGNRFPIRFSGEEEAPPDDWTPRPGRSGYWT